jgi:hypothetical protein
LTLALVRSADFREAGREKSKTVYKAVYKRPFISDNRKASPGIPALALKAAA